MQNLFDLIDLVSVDGRVASASASLRRHESSAKQLQKAADFKIRLTND